MRRIEQMTLVAGLCAGIASQAGAQSFTNGNFETGDLSGWTVANTSNGAGAPGSATQIDVDGPGPLPQNFGATFSVGNAVSMPAVQHGIEMTQSLNLTAGVQYTFDFDWSAQRTVTTNNAEGGVFSLIVDGVIIASAAAGGTSSATPHYGHINTTYTPAASGASSVGIRITRPFTVPAGPNLFQYVDNVTISGGSTPNTGACCLPTGACVITSSTGCTAASGIYRGDGSPCETANCPQPPTGACCVAAGCVTATATSCLAQNGTYQGNGTSCATANCPQPCPPITGTMPNGPSIGWPSTHGTQTTRLFRDGVPDTCALSASGSAPIAGSFAYDKYDFANTSGSSACVNVDINTACTGTNYIYAGAYIGAYDPNNPLTNNVASCGSSPDPTANMSFTVPAGTAFSIVFAEVTSGAGCPSYTFQLSGGALSCTPTPPSCYANCDQSTQPPVLNVLDFSCFLNKFAASDTYANCDNSTQPPVLNVLDFSCFLNKFAAGCT